jgi:hypothetical protein
MRSSTLEYMRDMARELRKMALAEGYDSLAFIFGLAKIGADELIAENPAKVLAARRRRRVG